MFCLIYIISSSLNVVCDAVYGCLETNWNCPKDGSCDITCLQPNACNSGIISVPSRVYKGLNVNCGDDEINSGCNSVKIDCPGAYLGDSFLEYRENGWSCNNFECCPIEWQNISCDANSNCQVTMSISAFHIYMR